MMFELSVFNSEFHLRLVLTLLHSLWQVGVTAGVVWLILRLQPQAKVETQYAVTLCGFLAGLLAFPVTFSIVDVPVRTASIGHESRITTTSHSSITRQSPSNLAPVATHGTDITAATERPTSVGENEPIIHAKALATGNDLTPVASPQEQPIWWGVIPWIVAAYLGGLLTMFVRLMRGFASASRLKSGVQTLRTGPVFHRFQRLSNELSIRVTPLLSVSERVLVPRIIGAVRPVILLPASAISGLSLDEVEMLLRHELAHLQRHDMWVNLLQRLAETVLFFNPFIWLLSRRLSRLREFCCDEAACRSLAENSPILRTRYASLLLHVAEQSLQSRRDTFRRRLLGNSDLTSLAANGRSPSELRRRITRLLGESEVEPILLSRRTIVSLGLVLGLMCSGPFVWNSIAAVEVDSQENTTTDDDKIGEEQRSSDANRDQSTLKSDQDQNDEDNTYLYPTRITGRTLSDDSLPISDATVYLAACGPDYRLLDKTTSDENGNFRFEDIELPVERNEDKSREAGSFEVFAISDRAALGWQAHSTVYPRLSHRSELDFSDLLNEKFPTEFGANDPIELSIVMASPQRLSGRIVDEEGNPIPDAKVRLRDVELIATPALDLANGPVPIDHPLGALNDSRIFPGTFNVRKSDEEGRFEFDRLPAGYAWRMTVNPPNNTRRDIEAATGMAAMTHDGRNVIHGQDFEVVFPTARPVRIHVVYDDTSEPAPGVGVGGLVTKAGFWETTDEDGFVETPLPDGEYQISASPEYQTPYLKSQTMIEVSDETAETVHQIRLKRAATLDITVRDRETGQAVEDAYVYVTNEDGIWIDYGYRSWEVKTRLSHYHRPKTDANGRMQVLVEAGVVRVAVLESEHTPGLLTPQSGQVIECSAGEAIALEFEIRSSGRRRNTNDANPESKTSSDSSPVSTEKADSTTSAPPKPTDLYVVIAKHVLLLDGNEVITWDELEEMISASSDPSNHHPHFYMTRGLMEAEGYDAAKKQIWDLHQKYKLHGHSEGSLWPRTDLRYDAIESAEDLTSNEADQISGRVVAADGKPIAGAEVILVTPIDPSIGYRSYHLALVRGRVRNFLEHVMTTSDQAGQFQIEADSGVDYQLLIMHPEFGFRLISQESFLKNPEVILTSWGGLVIHLDDPQQEQTVNLTTTIEATGDLPEIVINQYWSDLKMKAEAGAFSFGHVPVIFQTAISRSFQQDDGGSVSLNAASVSLLPGETRHFGIGPVTEQQKAQFEWHNDLMKEIRPQLQNPEATEE